MQLSNFQRRFSALFRDVHSLTDEDVRFWSERTNALGNLAPRQGLDIYRRNVFFGQRKVLEDSFPRTLQCLGAENFSAIVVTFLTLQSSQSEDLQVLSESFYTYVSTLDVQQEVKAHAMIDHAWERAFYAPHDEAMSWDELNRLSASPLDCITLELRSSATFFRDTSQIINTTDVKFPGYVIWRDDNFVRRIDGTEEKLLNILENIQQKKPLANSAHDMPTKELGECITVLIERKWLKKF